MMPDELGCRGVGMSSLRRRVKRDPSRALALDGGRIMGGTE